jgi:hypothetical protein
MNSYSIYHLSTGLFAGVILSCPSDQLLINIKDGMGCMLGEHDHLSQRVELGSGLLMDYQPPSPSPGHFWNASSKRWEYKKGEADYVAEIRQRRNDILKKTDWWVVQALESGNKLPAEMERYRNDLRDITKQKNFPDVVIWPNDPTNKKD